MTSVQAVTCINERREGRTRAPDEPTDADLKAIAAEYAEPVLQAELVAVQAQIDLAHNPANTTARRRLYAATEWVAVARAATTPLARITATTAPTVREVAA